MWLWVKIRSHMVLEIQVLTPVTTHPPANRWTQKHEIAKVAKPENIN